MARGLDTSVTLCEDILQKIQKSDEEREQLKKQLQSKAKRLKLYEKAGECDQVSYQYYDILCVCLCIGSYSCI